MGLVLAIAACGETLPGADTSADGGSGDGDAGSDATGAGDVVADGAGDDGGTAANVVTKDVVEPWRIVVAGSDLVVTSHATNGGGVFRVPASGGAAVKIGTRNGYGVAVKGTDDVWFCNADTSPGLVEVALDGGPNIERLAEVCYDVAVEPRGSIAFTQLGKAQRFDLDAGLVYLADGQAPDGIASDDAGVYFSDRAANNLGSFRYGIGPGKLVDTGPQPTRMRTDGGFVYWVESGSNKVQRVRADGQGSAETVGTAPANTAEGGLAVDETNVYWVVSQGPSAGLYRAPKGGGGQTVPIRTGLAFPVDVAVDATYAYVTVHDANQVLRIAK